MSEPLEPRRKPPQGGSSTAPPKNEQQSASLTSHEPLTPEHVENHRCDFRSIVKNHHQLIFPDDIKRLQHHYEDLAADWHRLRARLAALEAVGERLDDALGACVSFIEQLRVPQDMLQATFQVITGGRLADSGHKSRAAWQQAKGE